MNSRYKLKKVIRLEKFIRDDILIYGKTPFFLLILIIISSMLIINITYKTRLLIIEHEKIILEEKLLDIEWRNLILEESTLGNSNRIEDIALTKLHMQYIDPLNERKISMKD
ncbi:cell division protein FtsL [Candidatus Schneideria nysicola]|uniref:cell division protein FtsL n=1 Tax=Candidatus Schneideria nysicola TaxID=1081631 RepID=UPI001CAA6C82|nr:cell division protein FtsL [Candidatus Schneideria nysicola]UAJ65653.1 cell division protein FtsL [Candidatus Schneideria nysicola]